MFYEPHISKPIRGKRQVTIMLGKNGQLDGIPKAWREVLELPPQQNEIEEIDETLEINKKKLHLIDQAATEAKVYFELTAVVKTPSSNVKKESDEERPSYVITVKNKKKRAIICDDDGQF
jgi:hypothetical protein